MEKSTGKSPETGNTFCINFNKGIPGTLTGGDLFFSPCSDYYIFPFTGVCDINGKKIYEGDKVIVRYGRKEERFITCRVQWNPDSLRWGLYEESLFQEGQIVLDLKKDFIIYPFDNMELKDSDKYQLIGD